MDTKDAQLAAIVFVTGIVGIVALFVAGIVAAVAVTVVVYAIGAWCTRGRRVLPAGLDDEDVENIGG